MSIKFNIKIKISLILLKPAVVEISVAVLEVIVSVPAVVNFIYWNNANR